MGKMGVWGLLERQRGLQTVLGYTELHKEPGNTTWSHSQSVSVRAVLVTSCLVASQQMYPWASPRPSLPPLGSPLHPPLNHGFVLDQGPSLFSECKIVKLKMLSPNTCAPDVQKQANLVAEGG